MQAADAAGEGLADAEFGAVLSKRKGKTTGKKHISSEFA